MKVLKPLFRRAGKILRRSSAKVLPFHHLKPQPLQRRDASVDAFRLRRARRSDHSNPRPRRKCGGLHERSTPSKRLLPVAINSAGPSTSSRSRRLPNAHVANCAHPGAVTNKSAFKPRNPIAAAAEAHVPVPEEFVGPTPRSNTRISICFLLITSTNSTFVC